MSQTKIYTIEGDITQIPADAIITAINSQGLWFGGIDNAIQRVAGVMYHNQAARASPLENLQTIVAHGTEKHRGKFKDVVFVVDDLISQLNEVIYTGLESASNENYKQILVPTIRLGVMAGAREKTQDEALKKISLGVRNFLSDHSSKTKLEDIKFVVYNNPMLAESMSDVLGRI